MINGVTGIISSNVVTDVLTDSNKMIFKTDMFPINRFKSQTLVIVSQDESTLSSNRIVRTSSDIGNVSVLKIILLESVKTSVTTLLLIMMPRPHVQ